MVYINKYTYAHAHAHTHSHSCRLVFFGRGDILILKILVY